MQKPAPVTKDSFPRGTKLPEGVACDYVRAIIQRDAKLLTDTYLPPQVYNESRVQKNVALVLKIITERMAREAKHPVSSPKLIKEILKVNSARSLSRNGMKIFGSELIGFRDIRFVDVQVLLHGGKKRISRTLVVQLADLSWRVDLRPSMSELQVWLNEEKPSIPYGPEK